MKLNKDELKKNIINISKYVLALFVSVLYFEILLHICTQKTFFHFTVWNGLFIIPISVVLSSLLGFNKKIDNIVLILISFILSLFYIANLVYFKTFGSLFSISMVGNGADAITNFWWSVETTIKENIGLIILFELPTILLILEAIFLKKLAGTYPLKYHAFNIIIGIALWLLVVLALPLGGKQNHTPYAAYHSRFTDTDTASKKLGILPNALIETRYIVFGSNNDELIQIEEKVEEEVVEEDPIDKMNVYKDLNFTELKNKTTDSSIINVCDYLNTLTPSNKNLYTGMFSNFNLIYICAESFHSMAIDKDITPTLYKLANGGFILENYYNAFKNVTTNGEYSLLTGLWPDVAREDTNNGRLTGTMGQSIDKDMSQALGNMFNSAFNIQSKGFHNYYGSYYGRRETLPNMGFECKFMGNGMTFTTDWPASDLEMMKQSVDSYINDDRFCAYYMTFSGHGNYSEENFMVQRNIDYVREKAAGKGYPENLLGYFACNVELDKAMEYLLNRLEEAGKLKNTLIVLTGDHYPYYVSDYDYSVEMGKDPNENFNNYHSACIMYNTKIIKHITAPCCNVDILPTVLNLFGIEYDSRLYAGTDILSDSKHVAMIYNKSFITSDVIFDATEGTATWLKGMQEDKKQKYLDDTESYVINKYAYSIAVENTDFYNFLFTH